MMLTKGEPANGFRVAGITATPTTLLAAGDAEALEVVEQIFAVPGVGRTFVSSISSRDYPMIMGTTIVLATLIVVMNLISDILYKIVDPRIRLE